MLCSPYVFPGARYNEQILECYGITSIPATKEKLTELERYQTKQVQASKAMCHLEAMLRLLERDRVDPTRMTTHEFAFEGIDNAFQLMESKEDDIIKPLVNFE